MYALTDLLIFLIPSLVTHLDSLIIQKTTSNKYVKNK